ncbi:MAG: outer membrane protein assembly factor BamA [Arcobacteraceae bacterium]|nr:outer membrane protein assembly factor BamA [Arcobacteraceae bacterium]
MYKKLIYLPLLTSYLLGASTFTDIKFEGLSQISTTVAIETSNFKKNKPYSDNQINKTLKEFYKFGYFNDIAVTTDNNILTFSFMEKPFIASLDMSGYKTRDDDLEMVYNAMNIKKGNMYSKARIAKAKEKLLSLLEQEGYIHSVVEVEVENLNKNSVAIKFVVNKGDEIIVQKINFPGSKDLESGDFEDVMANKEEDCCFTWFFGRNDGVMKFDQLEYDGFRIKEKYLENGFLDAKVKEPFSRIDFNTNQSVVDIAIEEGKQYKVGNIVIYLDEKIKNPEEIYPELKLKKDKVFNISKLRKDVEYIKTQVSDKGYAFTQVKYDIRKDKDKATADIIYNVIPGDKVYINDIIISGNSRTLDRVIRRNVYLAPKDLFSLTDFKDSQNALNRTGFFETVKIEQQRVSKDKMNLVVSVQEAPTGNLILGGGYGSYDGFMINASVNDKNIFGSGLNLGFSFDWSKKRTSYTVSLKNPAINDSKYSGSVAAHQTESEITYTDYKLTQESVGFSVGAGKALTRHAHIGTTYSLDQIQETYDTKPQDNLTYIISSITPYINFNNTDSYFIPRSGMIASTSLEIAGVGGDAEYVKSSTTYKYFKGLEDYLDYDAIIRYRARLGILEDTGFITQGNSFYLGGVKSVRGYKSYAFGPQTDESPYTRMFANSIELSMPLIPKAKMRWGLFYDYGMVGQSNFTQIKRSGTGALIEWISPVGPLQFIFSQPLDDKPGDATSSFEFSLGSKF